MKILFTMCGRAGSKGIKNKNCMDFLEKPLVAYTISAIDLYLQQNQSVQYDIILNTDSKDLQTIASGHSPREIVMLDRKESLAGDSVGKVDVIRDSLLQMEQAGNTYDMVVDLDLTSPLRTSEDLKNVIDRKAASGDFDVIFTVVPSRRNPYFNMVKKLPDGSYDRVIKSDFTARQQAAETFDMNASIYAYDVDFLKGRNAIFDGRCGIVEMQDTGVLDLDRPEDFMLMETIGTYLFTSVPEYIKIRENIK